jgi:hypothetical protein
MRLGRRMRRQVAATAPEVVDVDATCAKAQEYVEQRRFTDAIDLLAEAFRKSGATELAIALADLRVSAARSYEPTSPRSPWPPVYEDRFPEVVGRIPAISAAGLDADVLGGAVSHHGALIVRGLFDSDQVRRGIDAIERAQACRDVAGDPDGWFRPPAIEGDKRALAMNSALRQRVREQGGTWLADSPRGSALFLGELASCGVIDLITEHLGERPFISLEKSTMRRSPAEDRIVAWHQDGSFLDAQVRTMNVWVALSKCGGDYPSPALEVAPFRIPEVLETEGLFSPNALSFDLVAEITAETPTVVPEFDPGDAILFDELFLHRTYLNAQMTEDRYALECWFFAPSHPATAYVPVLV